MNDQMCGKCGMQLVQINGRTLKQSIKMTGANGARIAPFRLTDWVVLCPQCEAYALGIEHVAATPFLCQDGIMRSVQDIEVEGRVFAAPHFEFCGFRFTSAALDGSVAMAPGFDPKDAPTSDVEELGRRIGIDSSREAILEFSKKVCAWGGGDRVWGNLAQRDGDTLADRLLAWLGAVASANTDETAINPGEAIDGLGISFASKHLRMLQPDRFAVLDAVLSEGLGFALNQKGYAFFMRSLRALREQIQFSRNIATLESGIFFLVRQGVRVS